MKLRMISLCLTALLLLPLLAACHGSTLPDEPDNPQNPTNPDDINDTPDDVANDWMAAQNEITDGLTLHGRVPVVDGKLRLFWTNSGFSLCFKGTGMSADLQITTPRNEHFYGYLNVYLDGEPIPVNTICVNGNRQYTLIDGLEDGVHVLEVRKRNEASYGTSPTITVSALRPAEGSMISKTAPAAKTRTIEFIGDSITCGFGNMWLSGNNSDFTTETEDGTLTYATLASRALGAEAQIVARSGMVFLQGSNKTSWVDYYEKTAMLDYADAVASNQPWDFDANPVDVVVINLGTNDQSATINNVAVTAKQMKEQAYSFLELVRTCNPDAEILWLYGIMSTNYASAIEQAVQEFSRDYADDHVTYLNLKPISALTEGSGVAGHPTIQTAINRSITVAEKIAELTGWDCDFSDLAQTQADFTRQYYLTQTDVYATASIKETDQTITSLLESVASGKTAAKDAVAQIFDLQNNLYLSGDVSDEYIVLDPCCDLGQWTVCGGAGGLDSQLSPAGTSALTVTSSNNNPHLFNKSGQLHVALPEDWSEWYLEMWLYVDDPDCIKSGDIELSQQIDSIEISYRLQTLELEAGWNHLLLPISKAVSSKFSQMKQLNNIRIFLFTTDELTLKISDMVLTRGKIAADRTALDAFDLSDTENPAVSFALQAQTQREVDLAVQWLQGEANNR